MEYLTHKIILEVLDILKVKIGAAEKASESNDLSLIDAEAKKQGIELQMAHAQAKVAQEIAIAQRIENAEEVIIEEYYEGEGQGKVGVSGDEQGLTLGVSGGAKKVTKRVYRFVGGKTNVPKAVYENET